MSQDSVSYNKDEVDPPKWLNDEFFTTVLHSCEKDETIKLKSFKITPAALQGDHYASIIFRVHVEYENAQKSELQSMSMILKTLPEMEGEKKELLQQSFVMETEIGMYTEVMPKFEAILRSIGDETKLGARCLYHSLTPRKIIIFEDLVPLGYTLLRDRHVNLEEAKLAYLKLAKLHAIGYKLLQENPADFDKYCHSFWQLPNILESGLIASGINYFMDCLETQPSLRMYKPYFEAMAPTFLEKCRDTAVEYRKQPRKDAHYVLCHGDFHNRNMMFKGTEDVMLLDYQLSYVGPIVNDVIYSIFQLLDATLRRDHLDELIYFYFSNFLDILQRIEYKGRLQKLIEFRSTMMQHKHWNIFLLTTFLPLWYGIREGYTDFEEINTNNDFCKRIYMNKDYIKELEELLPKYLHMGYLEN